MEAKPNSHMLEPLSPRPKHKFWVYVTRGRGTRNVVSANLHLHRCGNCNDGKGQLSRGLGGPDAGTQWVGFDDLETALTSEAYTGARQRAICGFCKRYL